MQHQVGLPAKEHHREGDEAEDEVRAETRNLSQEIAELGNVQVRVHEETLVLTSIRIAIRTNQQIEVDLVLRKEKAEEEEEKAAVSAAEVTVEIQPNHKAPQWGRHHEESQANHLAEATRKANAQTVRSAIIGMLECVNG